MYAVTASCSGLEEFGVDEVEEGPEPPPAAKPINMSRTNTPRHPIQPLPAVVGLEAVGVAAEAPFGMDAPLGAGIPQWGQVGASVLISLQHSRQGVRAIGVLGSVGEGTS